MPRVARSHFGNARIRREIAPGAEAKRTRRREREAQEQRQWAWRGDLMNWELFYLICFIVGFVFSTLSFLTGTLHLHVPAKWHMQIGNDGFHVHGVAAFLNSFTLMAFLTWFGGMGYLLTRYSSIWMGFALAIATLAGLVGASVVFWFFAKVLLKDDVGIDAAEYDMIGVLGKVSSSIRGGGTGW